MPLTEQLSLEGVDLQRLVVHCKRDPYDVYIGRPGVWGNPFVLRHEGDRPRILQQFEAWVLAQPGLTDRIRAELKGRVLGCWCAPRLCHGNVLARIANS